ncbi:DUF1742-domain-containing protein [Venturia nashicola]|uniref:DUF1742-domain-containing protein n=1 Tax=Venturia nashicola TaxID=86259 RepID=A0A4Z1P4G3_9PEZI|nr:DUF1742-domain-containing protein [Venturia nashicola]TLD22576.1 DUF1742-domain-containing protein [Venturia nashicola]
MSLQNVWHSRKVADNASKSCWVCFKPTTTVLITPDNKDFFYICVGHLKDRGFCTPDADEATAFAERAKKAEMDKEIEEVKKEYAEKMRKKMEKRKEREKTGKNKSENKEGMKRDEEEDKKDEAEKEARIKALDKKKDEPKVDDGPRIFTLHKNFYQQRLDRIKNAEIAKRNRERLKNPTTFPSVPTGNLP